MPLLEVEHFRKTFNGFTAVDDVSIQVQPGEIFGLLGPNGAGKSTTMNMLAGLLVPDAGTVRLEGKTVPPGCRELKRTLGIVPQELAIYPELTARENLKFFGRLYGVKGNELAGRIDFALEQTGLRGRADDRVDVFSGGMKRRLNFAAALLHAPRILVLDEPTVGVDPQSRSHLLGCVRALSEEGIAAIYASHYMEEVQALCRRVAIIDHGKMIACDTLEGLLGRLQAEIRLAISEPPDSLAAVLKEVAEVRRGADGERLLVITAKTGESGRNLSETLIEILQRLAEASVELHSIETQEPNLERLFLELTGHRLRD